MNYSSIDGEPRLFAFDLLMSDGQDLRTEKLTNRKQELRRLSAARTKANLERVRDIKTGNTGHVLVTVVQADGVRFKTLVKNIKIV